MTDLTALTAADTAARVAAGDVSAVEVAHAHLERIAEVDRRCTRSCTSTSRARSRPPTAVDDARVAGSRLGPLAGVPLALKDVLTTRGVPTTCGSRILEGWRPPYDATVVSRLREAGVVLGKTNMDEFAMGSSTENSAFGPTHNPWDLDRVPGGSWGRVGGRGRGLRGAARHRHRHRRLDPAARRGDRAPSASSRPTAACPATGWSRSRRRWTRPAVSRAPCWTRRCCTRRSPGHDPMDSTSIDQPVPAGGGGGAPARPTPRGLRVGVVAQFGGEGYQAGVITRFREAVELLEELGAEVVEVSCPRFDYALPAYYLIAPSECSSTWPASTRCATACGSATTARRSAEEVMSLTRDAGFGAEVKRRIMLGTYALSSGYYDAYYGQAQKVRTLISRDFDAAFEQVDVLVSPTTPTTAFPIGERVDDPMAMYLADLCTIPSNLAGNAAMSVPCGLARGRPAGRPADHGAAAGRRPALPGRRRRRGGAAGRGAPADRGGPGADREAAVVRRTVASVARAADGSGLRPGETPDG